MSGRQILPSWLLEQGIIPSSSLSVDTETSGLFGDSGARISTVSVAWIDNARGPGWVEEWNDGARQVLFEESIQTLDWEDVHPGIGKQFVVSMAWSFDQGHQGTTKPEATPAGLFGDAVNLPRSEWLDLLAWLQIVGAKRGLDMQNAKFDLHMFRYGCRRFPGDVVNLVDALAWDTQNVSDLLWAGEFGTASLKPTAARIWGAAESDEQQVIKTYLHKHKLPTGRWDLMPWDVIARYADQDARITARLKMHQLIEQEHARIPGWLDGRDGRMTPEQAIERRLGTTKMLYRMEARGLPFDGSGAADASRELAKRSAEAVASLPFKPATIVAAKKYWFGTGPGSLGLSPAATTARGEASVTQTELADLVLAGVDGATEWAAIKRAEDARSRWYDGWRERQGEDGRLRTSVRQNGTASGRFSVENIQLQAIPNDYKLGGVDILEDIPTPRDLIGRGVPEGWELWELDLAQAELRVAALFAKCERMLDLIEAGADLHGDAATELFHVNAGMDEWGRYRQVAKRANFSLIFGVGWRKLQADIKAQTGVVLTDQEAKELVAGWNALYPEYRAAIGQHDRQVMERYRKSGKRHLGWITAINGERRWFATKDVREIDPVSGQVRWGAHKAFNQRVQPNLAQFGLDWWLAVDQAMRKELRPRELEVGGIVLTVHDSVVLLLPERRAKDLAMYSADIGRRLWKQRFPGVPGDVDANPWAKHA